jgi:2-keto-4-pentenoate hydratase
MSAAEAALALVEARRGGQRLAGLGDHAPADEAAAYEIQEAVARLLGVAFAGWKVGAANPTAAPSAAPLFAALVERSPARFTATAESFRAVEAELAFSLARDLPARGRAYAEAEIWDALAAAHVAIELLDSRFIDRGKVTQAAMLADNLSNGGFCYGPPIAHWRAIDFATQPVELLLDGATQKRGAGANPAGHPGRLVAWLANHCASRGRPLKAGDIVTTGSHTGVTIAPLGAVVTARFAGLGEATLTLAAA